MPAMVPAGACRILDPFAGPTGIGLLRKHLGTECGVSKREYLGIELEPEWAEAGEDTIQGDATRLRAIGDVFLFQPDMVITSPPYGNRMADQYLGDPKGTMRHTYAVALGRRLSENSAAAAQWGPLYQRLMSESIEEICGLPSVQWFLLNCANHYRTKNKRQELQMVVPWLVEKVLTRDFELRHWDVVKTPKLRHGVNGGARDDFEQLFLFERVEK